MSMIRSLPQSNRARRYGFSFTPLADAMFQLLVFFMLTSSLAPYSLMTLTPGAAGNIPAAGDAPDVPQTATKEERVAIWSVGRGSLRAGGEKVALANIHDLVDPLVEAGLDRVVLLTGRSATVQDMAAALEALTLARIPTVQVIAGSAQ
ncbi:outer membrane transport energization protein ExbD [Litoreibacter meonggei]|uniref:Outer membrane transport energization protein ExbD n=1 Tax=Litoreibacter meonggei TaxID=1049199 RepID=A0A497VAN9_9RHOB|nr:biopolymer transporter ExbD [Litoreibacter meonggei]RLJ36306.1 outer membrane transport energization protein ExbD [Litoreibacter meonggei]